MRFIKKKKLVIKHTIKRCPECFSELPLNAKVCHTCNQKVGKVHATGLARSPFDWKAYTSCALAWLALGFFIWWAFFE